MGLPPRHAPAAFDDDCAAAYGRIRAQLAIAGTPIGPNDLLIAAIALTLRHRKETKYQEPSVQLQARKGDRLKIIKGVR